MSNSIDVCQSILYILPNTIYSVTKFRQIWSHCSSWSLKFECAVSWLETKVLLSAAGSVSGSGTSGKKIYVCLVSVQKPSWNRLGKPSITIKDQCQLVKKLRPVLTSKDRLRPFKIGQSLFASLKGGDETGGAWPASVFAFPLVLGSSRILTLGKWPKFGFIVLR